MIWWGGQQSTSNASELVVAVAVVAVQYVELRSPEILVRLLLGEGEWACMERARNRDTGLVFRGTLTTLEVRQSRHASGDLGERGCTRTHAEAGGHRAWRHRDTGTPIPPMGRAEMGRGPCCKLSAAQYQHAVRFITSMLHSHSGRASILTTASHACVALMMRCTAGLRCVYQLCACSYLEPAAAGRGDQQRVAAEA